MLATGGGGGMIFSPTERPARVRWNRGFAVSMGAHVVFLFLLLYKPAIFVKPAAVVRGDMGKATLVYLGPRAPKEAVAAEQPRVARARLQAPVMAAQAPVEDAPPHKEVQSADARTQTVSARAGSPDGSIYDGPASGPEVRPAIPTSFPDPPVSRSEVPAGVHGDVVVEITIDTAGTVVEIKLLKALGYGIEEKVIAAVQRWHFRPATRDGTPIPSKQDVHFHFPS
ncbi:MAG TPA: TonB family protein [Candidatus Saccharimonadales bacterium]|nr:TonB family protein [Candidatus Saccharimonadales bacterium]